MTADAIRWFMMGFCAGAMVIIVIASVPPGKGPSDFWIPPDRRKTQ